MMNGAAAPASWREGGGGGGGLDLAWSRLGVGWEDEDGFFFLVPTLGWGSLGCCCKRMNTENFAIHLGCPLNYSCYCVSRDLSAVSDPMTLTLGVGFGVIPQVWGLCFWLGLVSRVEYCSPTMVVFSPVAPMALILGFEKLSLWVCINYFFHPEVKYFTICLHVHN